MSLQCQGYLLLEVSLVALLAFQESDSPDYGEMNFEQMCFLESISSFFGFGTWLKTLNLKGIH